jgi:hypothetical protein
MGRPSKKQCVEERDKDQRNRSVAPEEKYDETVADSFPASDPPPSPSIIGPPHRPGERSSNER